MLEILTTTAKLLEDAEQILNLIDAIRAASEYAQESGSSANYAGALCILSECASRHAFALNELKTDAECKAGKG